MERSKEYGKRQGKGMKAGERGGGRQPRSSFEVRT